MTEVKPYNEVKGLEDLPQTADALYDTLQTIKQLDEVAADLKRQIREKLDAAKLTAVTVPGTETDANGETINTVRKVMLAAGRETRKLDVKKLQGLGVKSSVIEAAYTTSIGEPSVRLYTVEK